MKQRHLKFVLPSLVLVAVLVGVTASSGTPVGSDRGQAAERRDVFLDVAAFRAPGERPAAAEYARIKAVAKQPKLDIENAAPIDTELAPISEARVLSNDPTVGRIVAVPAVDGSGLCFSQELPAAFGVRNVSGCNGQLDEAGLLMQYGQVDGVGWTVFGLAADGVEAVTVTTANGAPDTVEVSGNGFVWTSADPLDVPIAVTSQQDGAAVEFDLPPLQ